MRFALFGDHPDGVDAGKALQATGRHHLVSYCGPRGPFSEFPGIRIFGDVEEVLADPAIEGVIVASRIAVRPEHVRRALQSEHHVLCVHPIDQTLDRAYEAGMLRGDTGRVLLPLLADGLHPGLRALIDMVNRPERPLGDFQLAVFEHCATGGIFLEPDIAGRYSGLPGWDLLRQLHGEIAEVAAFSATEELSDGRPLLISGRFERGGVFQTICLPQAQEPRRVLYWHGTLGRAELRLGASVNEPARLRWWDQTGEKQEGSFAPADRWQCFVRLFEKAIEDWERHPVIAPAGSPAGMASSYPSWLDEIRILELEDAVRRSNHYRRFVSMEYPEATEEGGFKGTMTLIGCGILWGLILLLILSRWFPQLGWIVIPILVVFLLLQLFRWILPPRPPPAG